MRRSVWSAILIGVMSVALFAAPIAAAEKILKVGVLGPFTGPSAKNGAEFKASVEMAMDKIDYKVGDYKIELVWIDSQSDPAKAASAYAEAVERMGIECAMQNWHSSVAVAAMDVAAQYKVPHWFGFGATEVVNEKWRSDPAKYSYWGGKGWPVPAKMAVGYVECLNNAVEKGTWKPANKKVAVYGEDSDWGRSLGGALKTMFVDKGWEIVSEDYFPITQTDFYPLLGKYKAADVSVLAGTSTAAPTMTAFVKQASEVGLKSVIIADGLGWMGDWYKMAGPGSNGVLDMIPQLTTPEAKKWAEDIQAKYGFNPSPSAGGLCYDGTNMFIKILKRTLEKYGALNKVNIHKIFVEEVQTGKLTFSKADGALIMNEYRYTPESVPDPVVGKDAYYFPVIQYTDGKGAIVYPEDWKEKDFEPKK
ncbi:ABC transporter substrate-binding protein [Desulfococcus sp.]|uniref:ABC transporter substrate-binding protein n=1 Tax=Desulfococcus sp. TaxID=2025834 RepID=UPI0035933DC0